MKISEIHDKWDIDCDIDLDDLAEESRKIPKLHAKYYRLYTAEHAFLRKMRAKLADLTSLKKAYYQGILPKSQLDELGWEPFQQRILKSDIPSVLEGDSDLISAKLIIGEQEEKVEFIESIIKSLNGRGFLLKTAMDFQKFKTGMM